MKALFVTELGAGYGNAAPLIRLAERLTAHKVQPAFALADGVQPAWLFQDRSWLRLPAPTHPDPLKPKAGPASYGDILALNGYADAGELSALLAQWDALFALIKPAFIVASHAPTAVLAARGRIPTAVLGTGFTVPPHHLPVFPALRPDTASFRTEQSCLAAVNTVLAGRGAPPLATLPSLLNVEARIMAGPALLDPYAQVRLDPSYQITPMTAAAPVPEDGGVFAFLDMRGKEAANAVEALAYLCDDTPVEAHIRGPGAPAALALLKRRGATVHVTPPPFHAAMSRAAVVLSQGGHGTCWASAVGGRQHVVMPVHFESMLNGVALERAGGGRVAWGGSVDVILDHLSWALDEGRPGAEKLAADLPAAPLLSTQLLLETLGVKPQRRGKPGSASASPSRGHKRQASSGARASSL